MAAKLAEVVSLYETNASNIADMLRQAAETIASESEEDERTQAVIAVQLHENGTIQVYGWGQTDSLKAIGTLNLGIAKLTAQHFEE